MLDIVALTLAPTCNAILSIPIIRVQHVLKNNDLSIDRPYSLVMKTKKQQRRACS